MFDRETDGTLKDLTEVQRKDRQQIRSDAELMQQLLTHPGWPRYCALIEAVAQNFYTEAMTPLENVMLVTKAEYAKGTLKGLTLAASLPSAKIAEAKELTRPHEEED